MKCSGRTTIVAAVLVLMCTAEAQSNGDHHAWVPVKVYRGYLVVAEGSVGSLHNRHLLIDTSAYPSVVDQQTAQALQVNVASDGVPVVGGGVPGVSAVIPGVQLGPVAAPAMRMEVQDLRGLSKKIGTRVDALIGLDVLARSSFRIDYQARQLVFGPVGILGASVPLRQVDAMDCVDMQIDGRPVRLLVASAAGGITIMGKQAAVLSVRAGKQRESTGLGGTVSLRQVHAEQMVLGDVSLGPGDFLISGAQDYQNLPFDGLFAPSALGFGQVAFDFEHQTLSWQRADRRQPSLPVAREGGSAAGGSASLASDGPASNLPGHCTALAGTSTACGDALRMPPPR